MRLENLKLFSLATLLFLLFSWSQSAFHWATESIVVAPSVTALEIQDLLNDEKNADQFVIVDVRSKAETDVSMIPGALTKSEFESTAQEHDGKTVIVYCTIGVRSGEYAASLNEKGWDALNYEGSILDWCGNNFPLTLDGVQTNQVHTYSRWYSAPENYVAVY